MPRIPYAVGPSRRPRICAPAGAVSARRRTRHRPPARSSHRRGGSVDRGWTRAGVCTDDAASPGLPSGTTGYWAPVRCVWCPFSHLWNGLFASLARMVPSLLAASTARVVRRRTMTRKRVALRCVALRCAVPSATPPRAARGRLHNLEGRAGMVAARSLALDAARDCTRSDDSVAHRRSRGALGLHRVTMKGASRTRGTLHKGSSSPWAASCAAVPFPLPATGSASGRSRKRARNAYEFTCDACGDERTCDACERTSTCDECTSRRR